MLVNEPKARVYYLQEAAAQNWTVRTLERNINSLMHKRLLSTPDLQINNIVQATDLKEFIKDPYVLLLMKTAL